MVNLYKFCKREILIQSTWRTSRTTSMWRSTQKVRATQNFIKDKMTGRVNKLWRIFLKIAKKLKNKVKGTEKRRFWLIYLKTFHKSTFLGPVTSILTFLQTISTLPVISSFLWKFLYLKLLKLFFFSSIVKKLNISAV